MTPEQQRALAIARARRRRAEAQQAAPAQDGFSPAAEADAYEAVRGTNAFGDATDSVMRGIPFSDEITSAVGAPFRAAGDWMRGDGFDIGRAYDEKMRVEAELTRRREDRSPVASTVGAVAGGLATAAPLAKAGASLLQGARPTIGSLMGRGAAEGAAYGAVYGAGEGRGANERISNALFGAGTGAATGAAGGAVARIGANRATNATIPSIDELRAAGQAAYQQADNAGVIFTPKAVDRVNSAITQKLTDLGYDPALQPGAAAVVRRLEALQGQNVTLSGLDTLRKIAGNGFVPGNKSNNRAVSEIIDAIDDLVANPSAQDVLMGNAQAGSAAMKTARDLWSRMSKAERVQSAVSRAELRAASTGSGGNADNATRQNLRRLVESPRGFTQAEQEALRKAVTGSPGQNALRLAGKLSPSGNGLMAALGIGGAMVNPAVGVAALGGMGAKTVADAMTRNQTRIVDALIRSGGNLPQTVSPARQAIADALMRGGLLTAQ